MSRTLFSEYVQQLAQAEWLKLSYGKLEILNVATWHRFARRQREDGVSSLSPSIAELLEVLHTLDQLLPETSGLQRLERRARAGLRS